jgi:hypothetical protein
MFSNGTFSRLPDGKVQVSPLGVSHACVCTAQSPCPRWLRQALLCPPLAGAGVVKRSCPSCKSCQIFCLSLNWIMLMPLVPTGKALRLMDTDHLAALRTGPFLFLVSYEQSYVMILYISEIVNHAHTVLSSIALIQMIKPITGKHITTETEP